MFTLQSSTLASSFNILDFSKRQEAGCLSLNWDLVLFFLNFLSAQQLARYGTVRIKVQWDGMILYPAVSICQKFNSVRTCWLSEGVHFRANTFLKNTSFVQRCSPSDQPPWTWYSHEQLFLKVFIFQDNLCFSWQCYCTRNVASCQNWGSSKFCTKLASPIKYCPQSKLFTALLDSVEILRLVHSE